MTATPWSVADVTGLDHIEDVAWSPSGAALVYVRASVDAVANTYRRAIWMRRGDASPVRFSAGTGNDRSPVWSPNGRQIAFVSNRGGDAQLYVIAVDGGEAECISAVSAGVSSPAWSPDGRFVAFVSYPNALDIAAELNPPPTPTTAFAADQAKATKEQHARDAVDPRVIGELPFRTGTDYINGRRGQLYIVEVAKGRSSQRRISDDARDYWAPAWSPDGASLWSTAKQSPETTQYFVGRCLVNLPIPATGYATPQIFAEQEWSIGSAPQLSPDGQWIAVRAIFARAPFHGGAALLVRPYAGGAWQRLALNDAALGEWKWLPDSSGIAYVAEWHGQGVVRTVAAPGRTPMAIHTPPSDAGVVSADFDVNVHGLIAATQGGPSAPCELWVGATQVTQLIDELRAQRITVPFEELWYHSSDGAAVQGWLLAPAVVEPGRTYGLILHIHGGPHAMWSPGTRSMWLEWQATAGAGFYVFFCNPRGSEGYGATWQAGSKGRWGVADQPDFEAGIDAVLAKGLPIDPARIGVTGGSYGGFMTTWLIGHSTRFAAAVSARGVYNLITEHSMSDAYELVEYSFDMTPWHDADKLWQASPIAAVADMHAPLLILHSELDFRVPIGEAEQLYTMLRRLGRTVEFIRYPREGHELTRSGEPTHQIDHMRRTIDWFVRYLQK